LPEISFLENTDGKEKSHSIGLWITADHRCWLADRHPDQSQPGEHPSLTFEWPTWVMLAGAVLLVLGLLIGAPDMAVPACIVAGIGGILYYQNITENWGSWAYLWTLIPGFVGIGQILSGVIGGDFAHNLREGLKPLLLSAVMFTIFATVFNAWTIFGNLSSYVPVVLLFLLGAVFIVRGIIHRN